MFDHVALGIELPGPLTRSEKWHFSMWRRRKLIKLRTSRDGSDLQTSKQIISADFDDPPSFSWMQPEMPHTWGPDQ